MHKIRATLEAFKKAGLVTIPEFPCLEFLPVSG